MGAPRVVPTRGIPYPTGDPALGPEEEKAWRRLLVQTALKAVSTAVKKPTVFKVTQYYPQYHRQQQDCTYLAGRVYPRKKYLYASRGDKVFS